MHKLIFSIALLILLGFNCICYGAEILWINGELPPRSKTEGTWLWDKDVKESGVISHTDGLKKGLRSHSFITEAVAEISSDSRIIQYVFLDPQEPPLGIMISYSVKGEGDGELTLYWEGDQEVFKDSYIESWYMGPLPKTGEWVGLGINCNELDIEHLELNGVSFITSEGRTWWGRTVIVND